MCRPIQFVFALILLCQSCAIKPADTSQAVSLLFDEQIKPVAFAAQEIQNALKEKGHRLHDQSGNIQIILEIKTEAFKPQCYRIRNEQSKRIRVAGGDPAGCMYGGLELAEKIRLGESLPNIRDADGQPYILKRGLKFNIPLDARTPSYDDTGDAAQNNIIEMWNFGFWAEFFDNMARHRYNTLTLWNPHPFPSMVKLNNYPDVALDDVCVSAIGPRYQGGSWNEPQLVSQQVFDNLKVGRRMTMDEKIAYWRKVMRCAKDRGIDIYFITWNICMNSVAAPGRDRSKQAELKKYGITNDQDNLETIKYLRACVKQFVLTYPDLAGIGVTAGENMRNRRDEYDREKWLWQTYGMGILDAKSEQPQRHVRFLHRVWNTGMDKIMRDFGSKYPDSFEIGFKYARARLYSSPKPPFADRLIEEMKPYNLKCWWNLRNDDIFCHRWGDPDYVRRFILNFPYEQTAGYHMGSDGYVWGREFTSLEPENPRRLEIVKHWYNFMLWGRLGFNPKLDRAFFEQVLADRFPQANSALVYDAWSTASKIIPQVNRFHWRNWDFMWAVEGCMDQRNGFHTVKHFIEFGPMEGSGIISVPDYVKAVQQGRAVQEITPLQVADRLEQWADSALKRVKQISNQCTSSKELRRTLTDITSMSYLGRYYAAKIRGAVELAMFQNTNYQHHKTRAVEHLTRAAEHWKAYAGKAASQYRPQLLARTRHLDWIKLLKDVQKDIDIARNAQAKG